MLRLLRDGLLWVWPPVGAILRIQSVVKQFGDAVAVDGVSLDIQQGEIFACWFVRLCKSTLLRMLAGFETPTSGQILLRAKTSRLQPNERPVNMMFQSYALFPTSVWGQHRFGLHRGSIAWDEIQNQSRKCWLWFNSSHIPSASHTNSRAVSSSGSAGAQLVPSGLNCCCWMSLWVRWTKTARAYPVELAGIIRQVG